MGGDRIEALTKISEKGRLILLVFYQYQDGTLTVGTVLTVRVEGAPFLDRDILLSKIEEVVTHKDVEGCLFLDIMGRENKEGRLISINILDT